MESRRVFLLAVGRPYPNTWNRPYAALGLIASGDEPLITFEDGFSPHDCGGSYKPDEVLKRPVFIKWLRERYEIAWLIPYIERMAAGEKFTIEQMQQLYFEHTGHYMEERPANGEFDFMKRPTHDAA